VTFGVQASGMRKIVQANSLEIKWTLILLNLQVNKGIAATNSFDSFDQDSLLYNVKVVN